VDVLGCSSSSVTAWTEEFVIKALSRLSSCAQALDERITAPWTGATSSSNCGAASPCSPPGVAGLTREQAMALVVELAEVQRRLERLRDGLTHLLEETG
jgi:hypothetical protein